MLKGVFDVLPMYAWLLPTCQIAAVLVSVLAMVILLPALALLSDILPELVMAPLEMVPRPERLVSRLNVVPESDRFVPAVYSVLVSVLDIVKFGYVPLTVVPPEPVRATV